MYVCIYRYTYSKSMDQTDRLSILHVVSRTGKINISLSAFTRLRIWSREAGSAYLYSLAESGAYFRDSSRVPRRRPFIKLHYIAFNCLVSPCMTINVSVQYNGGFLPNIMMLTQCYYHRGTRLNAMKRFCLCSLFRGPDTPRLYARWSQMGRAVYP